MRLEDNTEEICDAKLFNYLLKNLNSYFVNPQEWNFELTDSSGFIDLGNVNSSITEDILERPRNTPNDLGCYEHY